MKKPTAVSKVEEIENDMIIEDITVDMDDHKVEELFFPTLS